MTHPTNQPRLCYPLSLSLLISLTACGQEPSDLQQWQQRLAATPATPLSSWPNGIVAHTPYGNDPLTLNLFHPERLHPTEPNQALTFYPLAQLRYVGRISTPSERWAILDTPSGPLLAADGALIGLETWQISQIDATTLTLTSTQSEAQPLQLPLSSATPPS